MLFSKSFTVPWPSAGGVPGPPASGRPSESLLAWEAPLEGPGKGGCLAKGLDRFVAGSFEDSGNCGGFLGQEGRLCGPPHGTPPDIGPSSINPKRVGMNPGYSRRSRSVSCARRSSPTKPSAFHYASWFGHSVFSGSVVSFGNFVCAEGFGRNIKNRSSLCSLAASLHRSLLLSWDPYLDLQGSQGGLRSNAPISGLG